jgi:hypothetical protein
MRRSSKIKGQKDRRRNKRRMEKKRREIID